MLIICDFKFLGYIRESTKTMKMRRYTLWKLPAIQYALYWLNTCNQVLCTVYKLQSDMYKSTYVFKCLLEFCTYNTYYVRTLQVRKYILHTQYVRICTYVRTYVLHICCMYISIIVHIQYTYICTSCTYMYAHQ